MQVPPQNVFAGPPHTVYCFQEKKVEAKVCYQSYLDPLNKLKS